MAINKPGEERKNEIIDAAVSLFLDKGYEGTSMIAIAENAGLSKGGIYHHFCNKEEILVSANNRFMEPVFELMSQALSDPDPLRGLQRYIKEYLKYWSKHKQELNFVFLTLSRSMDNPALWEFMEEYADGTVNFYTTLLARCVKAVRLKEHDVEAMATTLMSALDGVLIYLTMSNRLDRSQIASHFDKVFFKELIVQDTKL